FDVAGSFGTYVASINSSNSIDGLYIDEKGAHGFVRTPDGVITSFDVVKNPVGFSVGTINDQGALTGSFDNGKFHSYVRRPDGEILKFDVPGAGTGAGQGTDSRANNSSGAVTGLYFDSNGAYHGFLGK